MGPGFQRDSTPWDPAEYLLDSFRGRRQTVLQNHFACLIQDAVMDCSVSQIQTDGQLGLLEISLPHFATVLIFFTAGLLSLVLRARRLLGAYRIPWRPAFSSHLVNAVTGEVGTGSNMSGNA